jgi:hypothetical protein
VGTPDRLNDKDAHDIYRILVAVETEDLAEAFSRLRDDEVSEPTATESLAYLSELFVAGPNAHGSMMAGRAEEGIGEPATVSLAVSLLATDLLNSLGGNQS